MILSQKVTFKFHTLSIAAAVLLCAGAQPVIADNTKIEEIRRLKGLLND